MRLLKREIIAGLFTPKGLTTFPLLVCCWILLCWTPGVSRTWDAEILSQLREGRVVSCRALSQELEEWDGSNDYYLLTLESGVKAVFRSEDEPWGSLAEAAAFRVDQELGTGLVPPTVERTLLREEFDSGWPWPEESKRLGSLQYFVVGAEKAEGKNLPQPDLANSEILGFVLGRYDNHTGNLLVDESGRLVMVDFEGALEHQMVRYGEFSFVRRGGWHESELNVPASEPFPFDDPRELVEPTLEELKLTFGPWWGQYWPQGMEGLYRLLKGIPDRTIPFVVWGNRLWVQVKVRSRHPAFTNYYPPSTMKKLKRLTDRRLLELLGEPFTPAHAIAMMERVGQLLAVSP